MHFIFNIYEMNGTGTKIKNSELELVDSVSFRFAISKFSLSKLNLSSAKSSFRITGGA